MLPAQLSLGKFNQKNKSWDLSHEEEGEVCVCVCQILIQAIWEFERMFDRLQYRTREGGVCALGIG